MGTIFLGAGVSGSDPQPEAAVRAIAERLEADRLVTTKYEVAVLARDMGEPPALLADAVFGERPTLAVRPRTTDELKEAVAHLVAAGVPFTPRGISSSGLGGAVPVNGGAILDLSVLSGVLHIDEDARSVTVRGGTSFYDLDRALAARGLCLKARPSNAFGTVGGWIAGGGLGIGSLGAGPATEQVKAVVVITPTGGVESLRPGDPGFADIFGTEGQLGILSEISLGVGRIEETGIFAAVFDDLGAAMAAAGEMMRSTPRPRTVTLANHGGADEILLAEGGAGALSVDGGRVLSSGEAYQIWNRRFFPMDSDLGPLFLAGEVVLPLENAEPFIIAARRLARRYATPLETHSHAVMDKEQAHLLVLLLYPSDPRDARNHLVRSSLAPALTALGIRHGGRPYGVGIWNTPFARARFGREAFEELGRKKATADPAGLLNPGKFFALDAGGGGLGAVAVSSLMRPSILPLALRGAAIAAPLAVRRPLAGLDAGSTADRCISCGACVLVCPAVVVTESESVSGRAKLELMRRLAAGESPDDDELLGSQRCLKCGQCAEVCARALPLVEAWEELELEVKKRIDDDDAFVKTISKFVDQVDQGRERVMNVVLP